MRNAVVLALVFVAGTFLGAFAERGQSKGSKSSGFAESPPADTLEIVRHLEPGQSDWGSAMRIISVRSPDGTVREVAEPVGANRPRWTIRCTRDGKTTTYTAESLVATP